MYEANVLAVVRAQEDAIARGDAGASIEPISADAILYDLPPPLLYKGEQARDVKGVIAWLATWQSGVAVRLLDPKVIVDGDLAVVFGLSRMTGWKTHGEKVDSWSRRTVVLRRSAGNWRIVHDHTSFPMAMDGSNRAVTDLKP
jgi:ketosteroid isomerase-like protein